MKAPILAAVLFALLLPAAPAAAAERHYPTVDFDRIQVDGPYQVRLATGRPTLVSATGSAQSLDALSIEVQGGTLHVRPNRSGWGGFPGQAAPPPLVTLSTRDLRFAGVSGSGSIAVDRVAGARLDIAVAGSGRVAIATARIDSLSVTMIGSGTVALAGTARQTKALLQGAPQLDAAGLQTEELQLTAETAGNVALAASRTARIRSTGTGNVTITGSAACTVQALGAGTVICGKAAR